MARETPPPPFMANTILNFHFVFWNLSLMSNDSWRTIHFLAFCWDYVFENGTYMSVVSECPYIEVEGKLPIQETKLFSPEEPREKGEKGSGCHNIFLGYILQFLL